MSPDEALARALHAELAEELCIPEVLSDRPCEPSDHRGEAHVIASRLTAQGFAIVRSDELAGLRAALTTIRDGYVYAVGECLWCMASIHAETDHKADCPVTIARSALEGVSR